MIYLLVLLPILYVVALLVLVYAVRQELQATADQRKMLTEFLEAVIAQGRAPFIPVLGETLGIGLRGSVR